MNRIKLTMPENYQYAFQMPIRITDLNYGGHVGNDVFLSLIHEARQQFLLQFAYTELDFEGFGLIMADVAIEYRHELKYGDIISISVKADQFDKLGFDIFYLVEITNTEKHIVAAKAKTGMICFDYQLKKKTSMPQAAINKLQANALD